MKSPSRTAGKASCAVDSLVCLDQDTRSAIKSKGACERTGCTRRARRCNDETIPEGILPDVTDLCGYTGVRIRTCSMGHGRAVCVMTTYPNTLWRYTLQVTLRHLYCVNELNSVLPHAPPPPPPSSVYLVPQINLPIVPPTGAGPPTFECLCESGG